MALTVTFGLYFALTQEGAQAQGGGGQGAPPQPMSFFVTSVSKGDGANYGGLAGADAHCQMLAAAAGRGGATWHAYLSTHGALVAMSVAQLHGDTLEQAQIGNAMGKQISLNDKQGITNGVGDMPNQHDILTGSKADGRGYTDGMDHTCNNYTSNTAGMGQVQLGHTDKQGGNNGSWNSAHGSRGCSQPNLVQTGGNGFLYCFAVN
jgi:hypothetical protein